MKGIVIYYSMTGNTKKIAEAIHSGMRQVEPDCELSSLRGLSAKDFSDFDVIGLGSPVIRHKELPNVTDFIEMKLKSVDGKFGFAFCTHGALPGRYLSRVVPAMQQRGLTIVGWKNWFGSAYYPTIPKPYFTDGHPDNVDLSEARDFGAEMMKRCRKIADGDVGCIPEFPRGDAYDEIYQPGELPSPEIIANFFRVQGHHQFTVNDEKCLYPKCTLCIDNCPMACIDFDGPEKAFGVNCARCFMCEQACPNGAIEYDWRPFNEAHLPMIPALERSLEIFETRGQFRRLVQPEDIGWDSFFFTRKHPRIKPVR